MKCTSLVKRHIMRKRGAICHRRVPGDRSFVTHTVEYLRVSRNKNSGLQSTQTHRQDKQLHTRARCKECTDAALTDVLVRPTTATQIETHPEQEILTRRARYTMQAGAQQGKMFVSFAQTLRQHTPSMATKTFQRAPRTRIHNTSQSVENEKGLGPVDAWFEMRKDQKR